MSKKHYLNWAPLGVGALCAAAVLVIYTLTADFKMPLIYIQIPLSTLVLAVLPVTSLIIKRDFPPFLNLITTTFTIKYSYSLSFSKTRYFCKIRAKQSSIHCAKFALN